MHRMASESATKQDFYRQSDDGKFLCLKCERTLSSKQRILEHLHKVHNLSKFCFRYQKDGRDDFLSLRLKKRRVGQFPLYHRNIITIVLFNS